MLRGFRNAVLAALIGLCGFAGTGCEERTTTTKTEVHDKPFGGKEVKQTEVTEQGDQTQVKETKTEVKRDGTLEKKETTIKGDPIK